MTILNTTYYVHETVDAEFRRWVTDVYFPSALNIGGLVNACFCEDIHAATRGYVRLCCATDG